MTKTVTERVDKMRQHTIVYFLAICTLTLLVLFVTTKLVLMAINVPVVVGMNGTVVKRTDTTVTLEVLGHKIRDCKLRPDKFVGWYKTDTSHGTSEGGKVLFPYDAVKDNSRPRSMWELQNFGLFTLTGIPAEATKVFVSSEHFCVVDGVTVVVTSFSGDWDITEEPQTEIYDRYKMMHRHFRTLDATHGM